MTNEPTTRCPADETLALLAAGDIDPQTRAIVLAHVERCSDCLAAVMSTIGHLQEEQSVQRTRIDRRWWMSAVAAAALIAVLTLPLIRGHRASVGMLVDRAPASERMVEPRLSGGFSWAPYRGPVRSADPAPDIARLKLGGVAGEVIERAENDPGAEAQHAAGVALVLVEKPDEAAARLEAVARISHDAKTWSDVAAARYEAAMHFRRVSQFPRALAAADEALRADARLPEALFNRALILERMGPAADARLAWQRYLAVDATSPWAAEARERVAALTAPSPADRSTRGGTSSN